MQLFQTAYSSDVRKRMVCDLTVEEKQPPKLREVHEISELIIECVPLTKVDFDDFSEVLTP